jgi:hypothetical protein
MADDLASDLREHLCKTLANVPVTERRRSRWVMNLEWLSEVRRADPLPSGVLWYPRAVEEPGTIFGLPVEVRGDGGVPHLELAV